MSELQTEANKDGASSGLALPTGWAGFSFPGSKLLKKPHLTNADIIHFIGWALDELANVNRRARKARTLLEKRIRMADEISKVRPRDPFVMNWSARKYTIALRECHTRRMALLQKLTEAVEKVKEHEQGVAYAKQLLARRSELNGADIPNLLAEAKMLEIKIQRELNK